MFRYVSACSAVILVMVGFGIETAHAQSDYRARVAGFVNVNDWVGLRSFLRARPELLNAKVGDGPELARFMKVTDGLYAALTFSPERFPRLLPEDQLPITQIEIVAKQNAPVIKKAVTKKKLRKLAKKHVKKQPVKAVVVAAKEVAPAHKQASSLPAVVFDTLSKGGTRKVPASTLRLYERVKQTNDR